MDSRRCSRSRRMPRSRPSWRRPRYGNQGRPPNSGQEGISIYQVIHLVFACLKRITCYRPLPRILEGALIDRIQFIVGAVVRMMGEDIDRKGESNCKTNSPNCATRWVSWKEGRHEGVLIDEGSRREWKDEWIRRWEVQRCSRRSRNSRGW